MSLAQRHATINGEHALAELNARAELPGNDVLGIEEATDGRTH